MSWKCNRKITLQNLKEAATRKHLRKRGILQNFFLQPSWKATAEAVTKTMFRKKIVLRVEK